MTPNVVLVWLQSPLGVSPGVSSRGLKGAMNGSLFADPVSEVQPRRHAHTHPPLIIQLLLIGRGLGADYIKVPLTVQRTTWQLPRSEAKTTESLWVGSSEEENETIQ